MNGRRGHGQSPVRLAGLIVAGLALAACSATQTATTQTETTATGSPSDEPVEFVPAPVVAVVGRPNVGKSTLVNRVLGRRQAVVEDVPGVTRDRVAYDAQWSGRRFTIVDTGGWTPDARDRAAAIAAQAEIAASTGRRHPVRGRRHGRRRSTRTRPRYACCAAPTSR